MALFVSVTIFSGASFFFSGRELSRFQLRLALGGGGGGLFLGVVFILSFACLNLSRVLLPVFSFGTRNSLRLSNPPPPDLDGPLTNLRMSSPWTDSSLGQLGCFGSTLWQSPVDATHFSLELTPRLFLVRSFFPGHGNLVRPMPNVIISFFKVSLLRPHPPPFPTTAVMRVSARLILRVNPDLCRGRHSFSKPPPPGSLFFCAPIFLAGA